MGGAPLWLAYLGGDRLRGTRLGKARRAPRCAVRLASVTVSGASQISLSRGMTEASHWSAASSPDLCDPAAQALRRSRHDFGASIHGVLRRNVACALLVALHQPSRGVMEPGR